MAVRAPDFPAHFPATACAFLMDDARCALQALAMNEGRHPWYYKPLPCWLHPITIRPGRWPAVYLPDESNDPLTEENYPGFAPWTPCGKTCETGKPAREVLAEELRFLKGIISGE